MKGTLAPHADALDLPRLFGLDPDLSWQAGAACAGVDPDMFFPDAGGLPAAPKRICAGCPVRVDCLTWALDHNEAHGVWGGLTEPERHRLAVRRRPRSVA